MVYLILTSTTSEDEFVTVDMNLEIKDTFDSNDGGILNKLNTENSQQSYYPDCPVPSSENPIHSTELSKMLQTENIEREEQRKLIEQQNDSKFMRRIKFLKNLETQSSIHTIFKGIIQIFSTPWELLLNLLTPKSYDGYYLFIHFLVPSILIWNVSELELFILEKIIRRLNISANFLGLTITAWGNNAPDMFNVASAMSKGMVDLAVNAAIASEIHNVLLGLALPWLVYNLRMKKPLIFGSNNIYAFTLFFFCFFVLSFIVGFRMNNMKFDNKFAYYLILCYLIFLTIISLMTFC
jgi:Ca2+/Na+ antiporter